MYIVLSASCAHISRTHLQIMYYIHAGGLKERVAALANPYT